MARALPRVVRCGVHQQVLRAIRLLLLAKTAQLQEQPPLVGASVWVRCMRRLSGTSAPSALVCCHPAVLLSCRRYDAGDNVKFNLPMAWSAGVLAWSLVDFEAGYKAAGEYKNGLDAVKWVTDYFIKCIGDGETDIVVQVSTAGRQSVVAPQTKALRTSLSTAVKSCAAQLSSAAAHHRRCCLRPGRQWCSGPWRVGPP